jgi:hypothetical protein
VKNWTFPETQPEPMTAKQALRSFEERLVPKRTVAQANASFEAYKTDLLPANLREDHESLLMQGFGAGFAYAMDIIRVILMQMNDEIV